MNNGESSSVPREDIENAEDSRRRRVAFEEAAKRMLRFLEDSGDLKVGVNELKEQLEVSEEACVSIRQLAPQARN